MKSQPEPSSPNEETPPELATFLSTQRESITRRWLDAIRENSSLAASEDVKDEELVDHLPRLFDDLTATLRGEAVAEKSARDAEAHGDHRWRQQYSLEEVLGELGIVCRLLLTHAVDTFEDAHPGIPKEQLRATRMRILRFFEDAAAGSVRHYVQRSHQSLGDLHEEVRATDRRLSEHRRLALDSAQLGWWQYDLASGKVHWDERSKAIYGVGEEQLGYEQMVALSHPDDRAQLAAAIQTAVDPRAPAALSLEHRVVQADGSVRWVVSKAQASFAGQGTDRHAVELVGTLADITATKAVQDAVLESEARFRQLAGAMPQLIWAGRPDGYIDYYNQRWYEYTGIAQDQLDKASWENILYPDDLERVVKVWAASIAAGRSYELELRIRRASDGEYRWFLNRAVPVRDAAGKIVRWIGTNTDIDDSKQLASQNAQLLDRERAARSEAERISHVKDEFLATLSHELRTPLNAILGWTQVLRGDPANTADMEAGLATIERNSRAQTQIIEDLLDMSKIISGKVRLDVQPLDLAALVTGAVEPIRPAATAKNIRLLPVIDPEARAIIGDPNRLQQVFWNLLTNAVKFTPKGGRIQVVLQRIHSHLEVSVIDSGEGIAPEFLPHVFDRFRQQDASTTRRHGGLGLGLAIVKQLVELHGGSVHVDSAGPGQGTSFRVMLPLTAVQPAAEPEELPRRHPGGESVALSIPIERLNLAGIKVLVVDDEADARALVRRLLEDRGASVRTAGSVADAMELFTAAVPDVLVSDIGMPEEDGYSLIGRIRALDPDQDAEEEGDERASSPTAWRLSSSRWRPSPAWRR